MTTPAPKKALALPAPKPEAPKPEAPTSKGSDEVIDNAANNKNNEQGNGKPAEEKKTAETPKENQPSNHHEKVEQLNFLTKTGKIKKKYQQPQPFDEVVNNTTNSKGNESESNQAKTDTQEVKPARKIEASTNGEGNNNEPSNPSATATITEPKKEEKVSEAPAEASADTTQDTSTDSEEQTSTSNTADAVVGGQQGSKNSKKNNNKKPSGGNNKPGNKNKNNREKNEKGETYYSQAYLDRIEKQGQASKLKSYKDRLKFLNDSILRASQDRPGWKLNVPKWKEEIKELEAKVRKIEGGADEGNK